MEKLRREWVDNGVLHWEPVYSAAEVDAYRQAVKALVELLKETVEPSGESYDPECICLNCRAERAIAAVERLEVE